MSAYAETKQVGAAEEVELRPLQSGGGGEATDEALVRWWRKRIETRKSQEDFKDWEKFKAEAKKFAKGDLLDDSDIRSWRETSEDAIIVQINLWARIYYYYLDAVFSNSPNLAFRPKMGRSNEQTLRNASSVEAMVKYVWEECRQQAEARRVLSEAYTANVAAAKIDYDRARGLFRGRWVAGNLIVDPECHGDLSRAQWVAEEMRMPLVRILKDENLAPEKRRRLYERWRGQLDRPESGGLDQQKTCYYVYTREGVDPLSGVRALVGEGQADVPQKVLFAIVEGFDDFLFSVPDPCPWLDEDEVPYPVLMLRERPGDWYAPPPWKIVKGLCEAINWLVSFHVASAKKKATNVILTNKAIWKDGDNKLAGSSHMEVHAVDGDPNKAFARIDLGANDAGQLQSAEALLQWLERISGFNEVARGEASGRKTATEAEALERNTSLVTKGDTLSFDTFLNEMVRQVALATLYYVPAFSRVIGPDGSVMTQQMVDVPVPGPVDPMTGMQQMATERRPMPIQVPPEEAQELGAVPYEMEGADMGLRMPGAISQMGDPLVAEDGSIVPGAPVFQHPEAGKVLKRGVDHFCGVEVAGDWPEQSLEDVKRDLMFTIEAGSTRAEYRRQQQSAAMGALQLLGGLYQQVGGFDALYELIMAYTQSLPFDNNEHYIPPRDVFVGGMQAVIQAQQQAAQAAQAAEAGPAPEGEAGMMDPAKEREMDMKQAEMMRRGDMDERRMAMDMRERSEDRKSRERIAARRGG